MKKHGRLGGQHQQQASRNTVGATRLNQPRCFQCGEIGPQEDSCRHIDRLQMEQGATWNGH